MAVQCASRVCCLVSTVNITKCYTVALACPLPFSADQLWFDDVDPALIAQQTDGQTGKTLESRPVTVGDMTG